MAEYLAPGVVIEEVQTNRPIEGVSTSTAGLVGTTERGPLNTPQLVTSFGEFRRQFGELLPQAEFSDGGRCHGYLPHAVEGFFTNGGKRCYITRVAPEDATRAHTTLFHADPAVAPQNRRRPGRRRPGRNVSWCRRTHPHKPIPATGGSWPEPLVLWFEGNPQRSGGAAARRVRSPAGISGVMGQ